MTRWTVTLVSLNIGAPASAVAIVKAETRTEAAARGVRVAEEWAARQRATNTEQAPTMTDGAEVVGPPDKAPVTARDLETTGSRSFFAASAFEHVRDARQADYEPLPPRFALWSLGLIHEDK